MTAVLLEDYLTRVVALNFAHGVHHLDPLTDWKMGVSLFDFWVHI